MSVYKRGFLALVTLTTLSLNFTFAQADAVYGPARTVENVRGRSSDIYRVRFRGAEQARVAAAADNDDIDLEIYDENGRLVASDHASDATPVCVWTPRRTQYFTIKVRNCERYSVDYVLAHN